MIIINKRKSTAPFVSIIVATYNSEKYLEETFESLLKQKYKNFEVIVIDGASRDKTLNIIKKYKKIINYCSSIKDKGIYDAFNKGIKHANGKYIGIVNSDDKLKPNALKYLKKYDNQNPTIDFLFGSVKKHWGILYGYKPYKIKFTWGFYSSHSTGFYIKRKAAQKIGLYNLKYKYHADFDYFYRMIVTHKMKGVGTKKNELFGIFRRGGFSSKLDFKKSYLEDLKIRINNKQSYWSIAIVAIFKFIKNYYRFLKK